ncbi:MAG: prepilin-type N-terminal cleavage/methylation domain-containing protein [Parcubacteria group bacterium]|jgi:prepilin-type N-terminal cleavage/methylation domain-containing protein
MKRNKTGFTLIEIMVAIAIVAILAAIVMVSMKGYGVKARSAKAQAQMSSVVPSMISCWGNGGKVRKPTANGGGNNICWGITGASNYGQWPTFTGDLDSYDFSSSTAAVSDTDDFCSLVVHCMDRDSWYFFSTSGSSDDDRKICCTKKGGGCASTIKDASETCDGSGWID